MAASDECPMCMEKYDEIDSRPYTMVECGHSVCEECSRVPDYDSDNVIDLICPTCSTHIDFDTEPYRVINYTLLDQVTSSRRDISLKDTEIAETKRQLEAQTLVVEDMRKTMEELKRKHEIEEKDELMCPRCNKHEHRKRMRICLDCAASGGIGEEVCSDQMADFVLCGLCALDDHKEHKICQFTPWKKEEILRTAAELGQKQTASMFELCEHEFDNVKGLLDTFNQELSEMKTFNTDCSEIEVIEELGAKMSSEAAQINDHFDAVLGSLRRTGKSVQDGIDALKILRKDLGPEKMESP